MSAPLWTAEPCDATDPALVPEDPDVIAASLYSPSLTTTADADLFRSPVYWSGGGEC